MVVVNNAGNFANELERERNEKRMRLLEKMEGKKTPAPLTDGHKTPATQGKRKVTEASFDPAIKSNVASSTINNQIEEVFGLLEENPKMIEIPLD